MQQGSRPLFIYYYSAESTGLNANSIDSPSIYILLAKTIIVKGIEVAMIQNNTIKTCLAVNTSGPKGASSRNNSVIEPNKTK